MAHSHRIPQTTRQVLMMKTVPANYNDSNAAAHAAAELKQRRAGMLKKWAGASSASSAGPWGVTGMDAVGVGKNGSSLQQPPQVGLLATRQPIVDD